VKARRFRLTKKSQVTESNVIASQKFAKNSAFISKIKAKIVHKEKRNSENKNNWTISASALKRVNFLRERIEFIAYAGAGKLKTNKK
jgi:hypothetical protein